MTASFMEVLWSSNMEYNDLIEKATDMQMCLPRLIIFMKSS